MKLCSGTDLWVEKYRYCDHFAQIKKTHPLSGLGLKNRTGGLRVSSMAVVTVVSLDRSLIRSSDLRSNEGMLPGETREGKHLRIQTTAVSSDPQVMGTKVSRTARAAQSRRQCSMQQLAGRRGTFATNGRRRWHCTDRHRGVTLVSRNEGLFRWDRHERRRASHSSASGAWMRAILLGRRSILGSRPLEFGWCMPCDGADWQHGASDEGGVGQGTSNRETGARRLGRASARLKGIRRPSVSVVAP
jgi:hypothetical protein